MMKRILALLICALMCCSALIGCAVDPEERGESITVYLSENIYDLDPANAYYDEATLDIVSLLFDTLFRLDDKGNIQKSLAEKYYVEEDDKTGEYMLYIELKDTSWSDGSPVSADDIVYAWKRILDIESSYPAAAMLYDIKNARLAKQGECSIDDVGIYAEDTTLLSVKFDQPIDYDQFILNLTSVALAPLRDDSVRRYGDDWAKKSSSMLTSGPFKLSRITYAEELVKNEDGGKPKNVFYWDINYDVSKKENDVTTWTRATEEKQFASQIVSSFVIERNNYYYRENDADVSYMKSVTPYKIVVDCSFTDEDIKAAYDAGAILYLGNIPMSLRDDFANDVTIEDAASTHVYYLNESAYIDDGSAEGAQLFAIKEIRQALSMAIDREALATAITYADAANGLVPNKVSEAAGVDKTFREQCGQEYVNLVKDLDKAKALIESVGIDPTKYSFAITVADYNENHVTMADLVCAAWCELGFNVTVDYRGTIANNDYQKIVEEVPKDICDNLYLESLNSGSFEVIALDLVAYSADPFSVLAPFAKEFSGMGMDMSDPENYRSTPHITGYDSAEYNAIIERIFQMKNIESRADNLRHAEQLLMDDMPVIPVVFNKNAYVDSGEIKFNDKFLLWDNSSNYYTTLYFTKAEVKNYDKYKKNAESFLSSVFDKYKEDKMSYIYTFSGPQLDDGVDYNFDLFKEESTIYSFLFPEN